VRHEDPVLATLFDAVYDDGVTGSHAVPSRASHHVAVTGDDGALLHTSFLVGEHLVT
jgi:anti-sigma factor RsiW